MDLFVEKDTDLMKATLIAVGLGNLFEVLPGSGSRLEVHIRDIGSAYAISVPYEFDDALGYLHNYREGRLPALIPAIRKAYSANDLEAIAANPDSVVQYKYVPRDFELVYGANAVADYEMYQAIVRQQRASKKDSLLSDQIDKLPPNYSLWAHLCSYFGRGSAMLKVYPNVLHAWYSHEGKDAEALLELVIKTYAEFPNSIAQARSTWMRWKKTISYTDYTIETNITASSVVSPSTVQGSSTKSAASKLNNVPLADFWLEMYLAFAGYFVVGLPFKLGDDIIFFYPLPKNITIRSLHQYMYSYRDSEIGRNLYRRSNQMHRANLDILTNLSFYQNRVHQIHDNLIDTGVDQVDFGGLVSYYYKNNGGNQIPFDETLFGIPPFIRNWEDPEQTSYIDALLKNHYKIIDAIRGVAPKYALTADELIILNRYRRFLTCASVEDWWQFTISYNRYRFIHMGDIYLPDLHIDTFKETLMNMQSDRKDFRQIMEDKGFQHIANAIRQCTVTLRYMTEIKKQQSAFRVRYGLGDDLLRNAHDPNQFIAELGCFLHDYARETSLVQAYTGNTRPFVTEEDIHHIITLIAEYGSSIVAHLLVATGYSTAYHKDN